MPSYSAHEAETQFSRLLDSVLQGERVLITKNGVAIAEPVPAQRRSFPLGAGRGDAAINAAALASDEWWRPMTDAEYEDFLEGRF